MKKILVLLTLLFVTTLSLSAYTVDDIPDSWSFTSDTSTHYSTSYSSTFQKGVKYLQALLNADLNENLSLDGGFGTGVKSGVKSFQTKYSLSPSGTVENNTKRTFDDVLAILKNNNLELPKPYIESPITYDSSINKGEDTHISVSVINNGSSSDDGGITVSFPGLTSSDKSIVTNLGSGVKVYTAGDMINYKNGDYKTAQYLMIEFGDSVWSKNKKNILSFNIKLNKAGKQYFYVRSAMHNPNASSSKPSTYVNAPSSSSYTDQQGWESDRYSINVNGDDELQSDLEIRAEDIIVTPLTPYKNLLAGGKISVALKKIYNEGNKKATVHNFKFYYSKNRKELENNNVSSFGTLINIFSVEPKKAISLKYIHSQKTTPIVNKGGTHYVKVCVSSSGEYNYANNCAIKSFPVYILESHYNYQEFTRDEILNSTAIQKLKIQIYSDSLFSAVLKNIDIYINDSVKKNSSYDNVRTYRKELLNDAFEKLELVTLVEDYKNGKSISKDLGLSLAKKAVKILIVDNMPEGNWELFFDTVNESMFSLYRCSTLDIASCTEIFFIGQELYFKWTTTSDVIDNNRIINSLYIALASVRHTIKFNRTSVDIKNLDFDFEILKIVNNIDLIDTSDLSNLFSSDDYNRDKAIYFIKELHKILFSQDYNKLLNNELKDDTNDANNHKPEKPNISINNYTKQKLYSRSLNKSVSNNSLTPTIYLSDFYDEDEDVFMSSWIDIRKVSDGKYLFDSGWMKEKSVKVPFGYLEYNTKYRIRARYKDAKGKLSDVSYKEFTLYGAVVSLISDNEIDAINQFGNVKIGECKSSKLTLTKVSGTDTASGTVELKLNKDNAFSIVGDNSFNLKYKNSKKEFEVKFCPTEKKKYAAIFQVTANNVSYTNSRQIIILSGEGVEGGSFSGDFYLSNASVSKSSVKSGESIDVSVVQHYSGSITEEQTIKVDYYLSSDKVLDNNDKWLARSTSYLSKSHRSEDEEHSITIPTNKLAGNYYILFITDDKKQYDETNENNNVEYIRITVEDSNVSNEDFYITDYSLSQTKFIVGDNTVYISSNLCYSGNNADDARTNIGYYLSRDNKIDASDKVLKLDSLAFWTSDRLCRDDTNRVHLKNIKKGEYYIITALDINHTTNETDENNNIASVKITVTDNIGTGSDFYLRNAKAPEWKLYRGELFEPEVQVNYIGDSSTKLRPSLGYYLSEDSKFDIDTDIFLGEDNSTLRINDYTENENLDAIIPTNIDPGEYYILFVADYRKQYLEADETNNILAVKIGVEVEITANNDKFYPYNQKIWANDNEIEDNFGKNIALDGNWLVVSAPSKDVGNQDGAGVVYVFKKQNDDSWLEYQKLTIDNAKAGDDIGWESIAIEGNTILVGSLERNYQSQKYVGALYIFNLTNGVWSLTEEIFDSEKQKFSFFGNRYDIDKHTIVSSAQQYDDGNIKNKGAVFIFEEQNNTWIEIQKIMASDGVEHDNFGSSVKINKDTIVVSNLKGFVYIYKKINTTWQEIQKIESSGELALSDNLMLIGNKLYQYNSNRWSFKEELLVNSQHITSVVISKDENTLAFGDTSGKGIVYIFKRIHNEWIQTNILKPEPRNESLGNSIAITDNGKYVLVGDRSAGVNSIRNVGAVYSYKLDKDSDEDGISDVKEETLGLNPNNPDTDGDGISDLEEVGDINNPRDSDGDGIIDALELDSDNDGVSDADERVAGTDPTDKNDKPVVTRVSLAPIEDVVMRVNQEKHIDLHIVNTTSEVSTIETTSHNQELVVTSETNPLYLTPIHNAKGHTKITVRVSADGKSDTEEFMAYVGEKPKKFVPIMMDDIVLMVPLNYKYN